MGCLHGRPLFNQNHDKAKQDHSAKSFPQYDISDQNNVSTIIVIVMVISSFKSCGISFAKRKQINITKL